MHRLAWFSPMPPARTGVAAVSSRLVPALRRDFTIDIFAECSAAPGSDAEGTAGLAIRAAHDFVWEHRRRPYDLTVFQLGNSSSHDFIWPYLFRYPGLAVLHDAVLHHARAATLLRQKRPADYRAEFTANHPDAPPPLAELAITGFDSHLYYELPMTRLVAAASRVTALHATAAIDRLREDAPGAALDTIRLSLGEQVDENRAATARRALAERFGLAPDAILVGVFGGLSPEKRIPQILQAFAAVLPYAPGSKLLLAGAPASHYDLAAAIGEHGLEGHAIVTGYVDDGTFSDYIAASDVTVNMRWPTAREISGPWLQALAAGKPTIVTDLEHLADVPSLDPRSWTLNGGAAGAEHGPITVAIDLLDEDHSLRLAFRRLATDAKLRAELGRAAREYWRLHHSPEVMVEDYRRVIRRALATPVRTARLPHHLLPDGDSRLREILQGVGIDANVWGTI